MVYSLSTPTALAVDAACHPYAGPLLAALRGAFTLTERGRAQLALAAARSTQEQASVAWGMAQLLDLNDDATLSGVARDTSGGRPPSAAALSRARLGNATAVARLVLSETGPWPAGPTFPVPGLGHHPAGAAAAAGAAVAWWVRPDLPTEHFHTLSSGWHNLMLSDGELFLSPKGRYGARARPVLDTLDATCTASVSLRQLAGVAWPAGAWADAMHKAAWSAYEAGRLVPQMIAVLEATKQLVRSHPRADAIELRPALHTVHALTVAALVGDIAPPDAITTLRMAEVAL